METSAVLGIGLLSNNPDILEYCTANKSVAIKRHIQFGSFFR